MKRKSVETRFDCTGNTISRNEDGSNAIKYLYTIYHPLDESIKRYVPEVDKYDILYIKFGDAEKVLCKDIDEDITMDIDAQGRLAGLEVLSASKHMDLSSLLPVEMKKEVLIR